MIGPSYTNVTPKPPAWALIGFTTLLLGASMVLPALGLVPLKMLPFDNKNEFQVLVDLPEGSTVEQTDVALKALADHVRTAPEVKEVISYAGTASPIDFYGMVRHYYLRQEPHRGDLRVNLIPKEDRQYQSHAIVLRLRNELQTVAEAHNARIKIVEVPPGLPALSTLVAEVYPRPGQGEASHRADTQHVRQLFREAKDVVDVDDTFEAEWCGLAKGNGRSRSTCSATWGWRSVGRCCSSTSWWSTRRAATSSRSCR